VTCTEMNRISEIVSSHRSVGPCALLLSLSGLPDPIRHKVSIRYHSGGKLRRLGEVVNWHCLCGANCRTGIYSLFFVEWKIGALGSLRLAFVAFVVVVVATVGSALCLGTAPIRTLGRIVSGRVRNIRSFHACICARRVRVEGGGGQLRRELIGEGVLMLLLLLMLHYTETVTFAIEWVVYAYVARGFVTVVSAWLHLIRIGPVAFWRRTVHRARLPVLPHWKAPYRILGVRSVPGVVHDGRVVGQGHLEPKKKTLRDDTFSFGSCAVPKYLLTVWGRCRHCCRSSARNAISVCALRRMSSFLTLRLGLCL